MSKIVRLNLKVLFIDWLNLVYVCVIISCKTSYLTYMETNIYFNLATEY